MLVVSSSPGIPAYDRDEWRHWSDEDGDCQDTRQEVLIEESETAVTFKDSDQCRVASGHWIGRYTGEEFTDPGDLDIDHMVPLANAHRSGGWAWSDAKKKQHANDLAYGGHLIAVQASANRSKGSRGPEQWKPPDRGYWCQYAIDWIAIKDRWALTASEAEANALAEMLSTCTPPVTLTVVRSDVSPSLAAPSETQMWMESYDSCDAAEEAGEPRVQGSKGTGHGFPQDMVSGARDGDGDGVVCER